MANKDKVEVKVSLYESEIKEYERQIENLKEQKGIWMGYEKASKDALDAINYTLRDIKDTLDWDGLTDEQKKGRKKPNLEITDEEGLKIAETIRPLQIHFDNKIKQANKEWNQIDAQRFILTKQILRLENLIDFEQSKNTEGFAGDLPEEESE